jgi:hypothetical protein
VSRMTGGGGCFAHEAAERGLEVVDAGHVFVLFVGLLMVVKGPGVGGGLSLAHAFFFRNRAVCPRAMCVNFTGYRDGVAEGDCVRSRSEVCKSTVPKVEGGQYSSKLRRMSCSIG